MVGGGSGGWWWWVVVLGGGLVKINTKPALTKVGIKFELTLAITNACQQMLKKVSKPYVNNC